MSKLSLYIADSDIECVQSLLTFFTDFEKELFYRVQGFVSPNELSSAIQFEPPDILLIASAWVLNDDRFKDVAVTILLDDGTLPSELESYAHINKYKQGRVISAFIVSTYTKISKKIITHTNEHQTGIISVYSPIGGIGKTSVAIGLAKAYAEAGEKTLYLNMEDVPSTLFHFQGNNQELNFSDVLYESIKDKPNLSAILSASHNYHNDGVSFIFPQNSSLELHELTKNQWHIFIQQLHRNKVFQRILIDMSTALDMKNLSVLSGSDKIILLAKEFDNAKEKLYRLEEYLKCTNPNLFDYKKNLDKFYLVENTTDNRKDEDKKKSGIQFFGKQINTKIPFDKYLALYGTIDMKHKFGDAIKSIKNCLA